MFCRTAPKEKKRCYVSASNAIFNENLRPNDLIAMFLQKKRVYM